MGLHFRRRLEAASDVVNLDRDDTEVIDGQNSEARKLSLDAEPYR
jgi:hypothetical protein